MATRAEKLHQMFADHLAFLKSFARSAMVGKEPGSRDHQLLKELDEHCADLERDNLAQVFDCQKSEKSEADLAKNRLQPLPPGFSALAPDNPTTKPVLRPGQRAIASTGAAPQLVKVLGLTDEDMHSEESSVS